MKEINGLKINNNNGYYLARCKAEKHMLDKWEVILIPEEGMVIQDMDIFHEKLVLFIIKNDVALFCSIDLPIDANIEGPKKIEEFYPWYFPVPSNLCNLAPGFNRNFMSTIYRAVISSPVMPDLTVDYDMKNREFTILHQDETKGLFVNKPQKKNTKTFKDLSAEICYERIEIPSHDGALIPLTILYKNNNNNKNNRLNLNDESFGLLHGYGSYGEILDKSFCSDRLSLINRGWVLAFADVRGGGGDPLWHEAGRKNNKINSIYDFAYCAKYLIKEGFVCKNRLGAIGSSAGGFLVGSTINLFPDLFSSAILKVPFLDILKTMLDPSLPLTILDYEEFGDPKLKFEFESICNISPYDNLRPNICYPPILISASFHDSRVGVWEAAKYVAKAREITCNLCSNNILLKTNMISGHFGEGGRFLQCEETAFDYAFLIKTLEN
ncbi:hypothetical protein LUZ60_003251 [Juncus effusus]|nr:hypothetical protein LUZ60_003251 [Juncus effusus]